MVENEFLVVGVDGVADYAEESEDLQVLLLVVVRVRGGGGVVRGQVVDDLLVDEVVHEEEIIPQQLLQEVELAGLIVGDHIVQNKLKPLGDMHLEQGVLADQFVDHLIKSVV